MVRKKVIVTPTKNLFDVNAVRGRVDGDGYWASSKDYQSYFYEMAVEAGASYTVSCNMYSNASASNLGLSVQSGTKYGDGRILTLLVDSSHLAWAERKGTFTVPAGVTKITFSAFASTRFTNFQVEKGTTATAYVPYGYLQSFKKALIAPTKNLFDTATANITDYGEYWRSTVGASSHFYSLDVNPGDTYTVSYKIRADRGVGSELTLGVQSGTAYNTGTRLLLRVVPKEAINNFAKQSGTFAIPEGITKIYFSTLGNKDYTEFQIEKGSAVTSYTPCEYLQSYNTALMTPTVNLFDISRATSNNANLVIEGGGIKVSGYGLSIGTLHQVCPDLKAGDQIMISWEQSFSTGTPATFIQMQSSVIQLPTSSPITITEAGLNQPVYFYNTQYWYRDIPTTSFYRNIQFERGTKVTPYVPYQHL